MYACLLFFLFHCGCQVVYCYVLLKICITLRTQNINRDCKKVGKLEFIYALLYIPAIIYLKNLAFGIMVLYFTLKTSHHTDESSSKPPTS